MLNQNLKNAMIKSCMTPGHLPTKMLARPKPSVYNNQMMSNSTLKNLWLSKTVGSNFIKQKQSLPNQLGYNQILQQMAGKNPSKLMNNLKSKKINVNRMEVVRNLLNGSVRNRNLTGNSLFSKMLPKRNFNNKIDGMLERMLEFLPQ